MHTKYTWFPLKRGKTFRKEKCWIFNVFKQQIQKNLAETKIEGCWKGEVAAVVATTACCVPFHVHAASCFQPSLQNHSQTQPNTLFTPICIHCTRSLHPTLFLRHHPFHAPFTPIHPPRPSNPPLSPPPPLPRPLLPQPPPPHRLPAHPLNLRRHHQNVRFLEPP